MDQTASSYVYGSLPTVADILELPQLVRGRPEVVAGQRGLERRVRWVHVSEVPDIAHLLNGGELLLSTGIGLHDDAAELRRFVTQLSEVGASGVVIELGRRFLTLPAALIEAADVLGLPVIALHTEVRFVEVTEAIHSIIVAEEVRQLRLSEVIHSTFQKLATESVSADDVVEQVARLARRPAVLENLSHHLLSYFQAGAGQDGGVLEDWESRSRGVTSGPTTELAAEEGWLVTPVGARGHMWGRLILVVGDRVEPQHRTIVEQGATTLALHRLISRDQQSLEHLAQRHFIADILDRRYSSSEEIRVRAGALRLETKGRRLIGMVVLTDTAVPLTEVERQERSRQEMLAVTAGLDDARVTALAGVLRPGKLAVVLAVGAADSVDDTLRAAAIAVRSRLGLLAGGHRPTIAVGATVTDLDDLRVSLFEAAEVADASYGVSVDQPLARVTDIRLRGLVHLLRGDERLQAFAEREVGRILSHDKEHKTKMFATLTALLNASGNKSDAARMVHVSRPTFYHQLAKLEELLGVDLDSAESRASLYVAVLAANAARGQSPSDR